MTPDQCTCADCETTRAIAARARRDRNASSARPLARSVLDTPGRDNGGRMAGLLSSGASLAEARAICEASNLAAAARRLGDAIVAKAAR